MLKKSCSGMSTHLNYCITERKNTVKDKNIVGNHFNHLLWLHSF